MREKGFFSGVTADLGIKATEAFLNTLRQEIGDDQYDRLCKITPFLPNKQAAAESLVEGKRLRFLQPDLSATVKKEEQSVLEKSLAGLTSNDPKINEPRHDLSD